MLSVSMALVNIYFHFHNLSAWPIIFSAPLVFSTTMEYNGFIKAE